MAIHYNLAKVHAISDNDDAFVRQILTLFITEVPEDLAEVREGIKEKDYQRAYAFAHKIKPTFDLLGMTVAFDEIRAVEEWTKRQGKKKEIKDTFVSIADKVEKATREIRKDFDI